MIKKMLVNATHPEENRVAIVEDGILSELDIEIAGQEQTKGNIYKAAVVRVEPGLQAAFVDYGAERLGFLQLGELHPNLYPKRDDEENKSRPRINEILHRGQELLVQITKEERGNKGAALTTYLSLPGRYMVLMPDDDARGISRKIPDGADRKSLRQAISAMDVPETMGIIVRTAAIGKTSDELQRDLDYLLKLQSNIVSHAKQTRAPALIYQESNLVIRSIRDYFMPDMDEVLIDDPAVYNEAREFFTQVMPDHAKLVKLHQEQRPIFSKYQIEEQIETIAQSQVSMPSGGSIVIDQTEALVAIDVNSGKMASEQGIEATAYKSNLEAASEVARQLRLRDLGGLVVIDFIDMRDRKHTREVEKRLKDALKNDKARVTVGRISQFGLLEMSRQRIKQSLAAAAWNACPHCKGRGKVKSTEAQAVAIMRKIHAAVAKKQIERVEAQVPAEVAEYLLNTRREELLEIERRYKTQIYLSGGPELVAEEVEFEFKKREKRPTDNKEESAPVTAATALADTAAIERPHQPANEETEDDTTQPHPQTKKKRSRRGRGGARSESSEQDNATGQSSDEETVDEPSSNENKEQTDETTGEAPRRRRRRRRGRRSKSDQEAAEKTTEATQTDPPAEQPAGETADLAAPEVTEEQPKRRGRRKPAADQKTEPTTDSEQVAPQAETQPADNIETSEEPAKPKRRRSPRKKKETTSPDPATTAVESVSDEKAPAPETASDNEESPAKPKRTRAPRKKSEPAPTEAAPQTAASDAVTETTEAAKAETTDEEPPAKPKRRRPTKKKVEATPAVEAVETGAEQTKEEQPKPRRRGRPKKAVEPTDKTPLSATEAAQPATAPDKPEAQEAEKPKPARRTRRKKAEPTEAASAETAGQADEQPAPKPRRRSTRAKKTEEEVSAPSTADSTNATEGDAEQKPKPKRRSPRKKATPAGDETKSDE